MGALALGGGRLGRSAMMMASASRSAVEKRRMESSYCRCLVALAMILLVLVLSLCSRSVSGESALGAFASATVLATCQKLVREGEFARSISKQDELPLVALLHNTEALTLTRCARRLAEEYLLPVSPELLDLLQELQEENDIIIQNALAAP